MAKLEFRPKSIDDDTMVNVVVLLTNGASACAHETYAYPEDLAQFGTALKQFPRSLHDEAILELGLPDPGWHNFFRLRAFVVDAKGHSALEIHADNHREPPDYASHHFFVRADPADLNGLGQAIVAWSSSPTKEFTYEWKP